MNRIIVILVAVLLQISTLHAQKLPVDLICKPEDKQIAEAKLNQFLNKKDIPIAELVVEIGLSFLGTPYVVGSLENGLEEKMVVNLRELDCTTFAENCLALARTVKSGRNDFASFVAELSNIRYRQGVRNQYLSRLHYFSEWVSDNARKGLVDDSPNVNGIKSDKPINFMSTHPNSYPALKEHPEIIPELKNQEDKLTQKGFRYFPKNDLNALYNNLKNGDLIALTSSIDGIDVNHVGIIMKRDTSFYLLHAPLSGKKVLISEGPIADFLKPESKNNGIIIARPVF